jgi:predicted O-methyltransferase YrrM
MIYKNPEVESSYSEHDIGQTLYNLVLELKPKKIIEFGTLNGYSAISMAMALQELNNGGKITCYDLWDAYPYKHSTIDKTTPGPGSYNSSD